MAYPTEQRNPVEALGEEFLERRRRGEPATVENYAAAHPELAREIRRLFPAMVAMEQFKTCKLSSHAGPVEMDVERLEQLGDYRIVREIGRGGMGVVYEAEQQSLGRRVAVKVFPRQVLRDSRQLKRFHREARTAASLHHTNIVPVFGVGEQDGLNYYVMQRIQGVSLDEVIDKMRDRQRLPVADEPESAACSDTDGHTAGVPNSERPTPQHDDRPGPGSIADVASYRNRQRHAPWRDAASIGIQVAEALSYAHEQGVLHRDIKPSNLLQDSSGAIWVADFGLATFIETEKLSNPGDLVGTLRFMAPETFNGDQDARSDIYSLGLTMYELLTLRPAFEERSRTKLVRSILNGEAGRPRALRPEIPRDLEAIVLKAMAKDPRRRYHTAAELAADLRRFKGDLPVKARRIGYAGRLSRWTRRNPAIAALSSALLLLAMCSFLLIGAKWRETVIANCRAEDNLSLALESMDRMLERFASSWMAHPMVAEGADGEATAAGIELHMVVSDHSARVLEDALGFYDRFAKQNPANPRLQRDTAKVHRRVGDIYERLGQYTKAEAAYRRSLNILSSQRLPEDLALAVETAKNRNQLGLTMYATSRFSEAEAEFRRARTVLSETPFDDDPASRAELARANSNLGQSVWLLGRRDEAKREHRRAIDLLERLVHQYPRNADYRLELARAYRTYYPFALFSNRKEEHQRIGNAGTAILEELVRDFPDVPDYQCELSSMLTTTSSRRPGPRNVGQQTRQLQRAVSLARELTISHPSIPRYRAILARALKESASAIRETHSEEADAFYTESVDCYRGLTQEFPEIPAYHMFLAITLGNHAIFLSELRRLPEARDRLRQAVIEQKVYVTLRPQSDFGRRILGRLYEEMAETHTELEASEEAKRATTEALRPGSHTVYGHGVVHALH